MNAFANAAVERVAGEYRRRGYEVEIEPRGDALPDFLREFTPDLIARSADESVVVEVKVGTRFSTAEQLRSLVRAIAEHPGWRFSLVYVDPQRPDEIVEATTMSLPDLKQNASKAETLIGAGHAEAGFLLLWSTLEGVLRYLSDRTGLPVSSLPTSALIRELYSAGELAREDFELLMTLLPIRDRLVHGLGPKPDLDAHPLIPVVRTLIQDAEAA